MVMEDGIEILTSMVEELGLSSLLEPEHETKRHPVSARNKSIKCLSLITNDLQLIMKQYVLLKRAKVPLI